MSYLFIHEKQKQKEKVQKEKVLKEEILHSSVRSNFLCYVIIPDLLCELIKMIFSVEIEGSPIEI